MLKVYNAEYRRNYTAPLISTGTFCCFIAAVATIILPFFIAYATQQFWISTGVYYEQPKVKYTGELFLNIATQQESYSYCTLNSINQQFANAMITPIIENSNEDTNFDGINDILTVRAIIPIDPSKVVQVNMLVGLNYELVGWATGKMDSGIFVSFDTGAGASLIKSAGELRLKQTTPLSLSSKPRTLYTSIFQTLQKYSYTETQKEYYTRNMTLEYKANSIILPYGDSQTTVELKIRIPTRQDVSYEAGLIEMMKNAWIQYIYILIPLYFVMYELVMWIMIRFNIVSSQPEEDEQLTQRYN